MGAIMKGAKKRKTLTIGTVDLRKPKKGSIAPSSLRSLVRLNLQTHGKEKHRRIDAMNRKIGGKDIRILVKV